MPLPWARLRAWGDPLRATHALTRQAPRPAQQPGGTSRERALLEENQKLRAAVDKVTGTARELARTIARLEAEAEDRGAVEKTLRRALEGAGVDDPDLFGPSSGLASVCEDGAVCAPRRPPCTLPPSNVRRQGGGQGQGQGPGSPPRAPPAIEAHLRAAIADRSHTVERSRHKGSPCPRRASGSGAASGTGGEGQPQAHGRTVVAEGGSNTVLSLQEPEAEASSASVIGMPPSRVPPPLRTTTDAGMPSTPSGGMSSPAALAPTPMSDRTLGDKRHFRRSARERAQSAFLTDMQNSAPPSRPPPPRPVREAPRPGRESVTSDLGAEGADHAEGSESTPSSDAVRDRATEGWLQPGARRDGERRGSSERAGQLFETLASAAEGR